MNTISNKKNGNSTTAQERQQPLITKPLRITTLYCAITALPTTALATGFGLDVDNIGVLNGPQDAAADVIQGPDDGTGRNRAIPDTQNPAGLCPALLGRQDLASHPDSLNLSVRCTELIVTAHPGVQVPSAELGLDDPEIRSALQQVVPEESEIIGTGATDTSHDQLANIGSRLQYLRTGTSTLPIAGVHTGGTMSGSTASADGYNRWGFFINGNYGTGEKDETFNENGFDFDAYGITIGIDYRFNDNFVGGIAVGMASSDVDIDDNAGEYDTDGENIAVYALYNGEKFYVEGSLTYGSYDYEGERIISYGPISLTADSDTDGDQLAWSLGVGYSTYKNRWNLSYYGRLEGLDAEVDSYNETGSGNVEWLVHVDDQDVDSLQAVLGVQAAFAISRDFGVIQPYANLEVHHEFDDDSRNVTAFYLADPFFAAGDTTYAINLKTDDPDETFFLLTLGTTFVFKGGTQLFFNYDTVLGLDDVDSHSITAGLRIEF